MPQFTVDQLRTEAIGIVERIGVDEQVDAMIVGSVLVIVLTLALVTIWKNRRRTAEVPATAPSAASGFTRWLTPMGMKSVSPEQAVVARPRRKSGSNKTIKVSTPVSKVPTRALKGARADALDIARKTGLARDAVVMMMANANPQPAAKKSAAKPAAQPATRTVATERGMTAPGAYGAAPRTPAATTGRALGTQFNARLS